MFDLHVSLTGVPVPFDSRVTGVDLARVVRVEEALTAGLKALNEIAAGNAAGNQAPAADGKRGTVKLVLGAKKDGKPFADAVFTWHDMPEAYAAGLGEVFAGLDDAVAKG